MVCGGKCPSYTPGRLREQGNAKRNQKEATKLDSWYACPVFDPKGFLESESIYDENKTVLKGCASFVTLAPF